MPRPMHRRTALGALLTAPFAIRAHVRQGLSEWRPLFNGRDLDGWETYLGRPHKSSTVEGLAKNAGGDYTEPLGFNRDPTGVFSVVSVDGAPAIRISGEIFGALVTREEHGDYHLRFEFKWGERRWPPREQAVRDSGCCYHSAGPAGASYGFWLRSFEFQIQEGDCGDFYSLAGVLVDVDAVAKVPADPKSDLVFERGAPKVVGTTRRVIKSPTVEKPNGQWNSIELYCLGQTSVHVVNGRTALVLTGLRQKSDSGETPLTRGRLQLQSEGSEVFYRNIELRPIRAIPAPVIG